MKYKNYVSKITGALTTYKNGIDKLENDYKLWQKKTETGDCSNAWQVYAGIHKEVRNEH